MITPAIKTAAIRRPVLLDGDCVAALGAAAADHILPALGSHAGAEAVHLVLAGNLWLVGSFWHYCLLLRVCSG